MSQKLGILGGTFNPVHFGHLIAAEEIRGRLNLDRILFVPSSIPPHKRDEDVPPAFHRIEMVRLATEGNSRFEVSDIEIRRGGKSYTIETIDMLHRTHQDADFYFITGLDAFLEIQTWNQWERLLTECFFVVLSRPGYRFTDLKKMDFMRHAGRELNALDAGTMSQSMVRSDRYAIFLERIPLYDISSTGIRGRIKAGLSIKYFLPDAVEIYIIENKLYV